MCTVSFVPVNGKYFITSNRDEKITRKHSHVPQIHIYNGCKLIYSKDPEGGGTWFTVKENGDAAVLLNGAFESHVSDPPYRKSRGLIFLDIMATERPSLSLLKIELNNIEPFTIILKENNSLYEFRWDGANRHCKQLPLNRPHIWSSATLYDKAAGLKREQLFAKFLNNTTIPTQQDIVTFHRYAGDGNTNTDLVMDREGTYRTVSITNILLTDSRTAIKYVDLTNNYVSEMSIALLIPEQVI